MMNMLGSGAYAKVLVEDEFAVKVIPVINFKSAVREISFINACEHKNVIKVNKVKYTHNEVSIYMKRYNCDLYDYIDKTLLPLDIVYKFTKELLEAIAHIHSRGIIHGDIKPENILVDTTGEPSITVCDFGISMPNIGKYHRGRVQTSTYRAPEVDYDKTKVQYTNSIDMWSLGCILFEMAVGNPIVNHNCQIEDSTWYACEFFGLYKCDSRRDRIKILKNVNIRFIRKCICDKLCDQPERYRSLFDSGYIELIAHCLCPNHNKRIDAKSALSLINRIMNLDLASIRFENNPIGIDSKKSMDDMNCLINVDHQIISLCSRMCLLAAENIYTNYASKAQCCELTGLVSIFLAACLFPATEDITHFIEKTIKYKKLIRISSEIMHAMNGKLLLT